MSEYIIKETGYPGAIEQEVVQELVRCRYCECWYPEEDDEYGHCRKHDFWTSESWFCADGEER